MSSSLNCSDAPEPSMNLEAVLHMKEGIGETSYAKNCTLQKKSMESVKSLVTKSARDVYASLRPERFTLADLGCSSGTNALGMVEEIVRSVLESCRGSTPPPEFSVLLNDLPTNDFNTIFSRVPEFTGKLKADAGEEPMVFLSGVPGSFYGRLFPSRSVHFVCSFSSLHWLSQVPPGLSDETNGPVNRGKMFISSTSPPAVAAAYSRQFRRDFSLFLRSRAAEVVSGGRMVLAMLGRKDDKRSQHADRNTTLLWDLLSESLAVLVSRGMVEQGKLDAYDAPFYAPSVWEVEEEARREGSFAVSYARAYEANLKSGSGDARRDGRTVAMAVRAIQEPMLGHHFGMEIIDPLFAEYTELVTAAMEREEVKSVQIGVVLTRL
uniref:Jasmonate O-methyltransferase n=1 Tax=Leersia perrieri TaxID=77586 RepID=A0A0D9V4M1_9ORYZ